MVLQKFIGILAAIDMFSEIVSEWRRMCCIEMFVGGGGGKKLAESLVGFVRKYGGCALK
jgi:hypothetical protein